jgi:LPS O-antigen subunit length determinant protein (WzzB/FepE family)
VFDIVDPAVVPEMKSRPLRSLICIAITLGGFLFAVMVVLMRDFVRSVRGRIA